MSIETAAPVDHTRELLFSARVSAQRIAIFAQQNLEDARINLELAHLAHESATARARAAAKAFADFQIRSAACS